MWEGVGGSVQGEKGGSLEGKVGFLRLEPGEGEAGGQASLISWNSYIGIPINFYEESGIVTFCTTTATSC